MDHLELASAPFIGGLPGALWRQLIWILSPPVYWGVKHRRNTGRERRWVLLQLRRACRTLHALIARDGRGGLGILQLRRETLGDFHWLRDLPDGTRSFGSSLVIRVERSGSHKAATEWLLDTLEAACDRGHMIIFRATNSGRKTAPALATVCEILHRADARGLLREASFVYYFKSGWDPAPVAQLSTAAVSHLQDRDIEALMAPGTSLCSLAVSSSKALHSLEPLAGLRRLHIYACGITDIEPLVRIPDLTIELCHGILTWPTMHNMRLAVVACVSFPSLGCLRDGSVQHLTLESVDIADFDALAAAPRLREVVFVAVPDLTTAHLTTLEHKRVTVTQCARVDADEAPDWVRVIL